MGLPITVPTSTFTAITEQGVTDKATVSVSILRCVRAHVSRDLVRNLDSHCPRPWTGQNGPDFGPAIVRYHCCWSLLVVPHKNHGLLPML